MVIGLDFGTSYTKVVLGESRVQYAVPMQEEAQSDQRYLLPCVLRVDEQGECTIAEPTPGSTAYTDLKITLLERRADLAARARVVAYLALVLRHCRGWLMNAKEGVYRKNQLDWFVNIGLPTDSALDEALAAEYQLLVLAAWRISAKPGPIGLDAAVAALAVQESAELEPDGAELHPDAVQPFPEFAAQVASYVRSPVRNEGLHALIDVGAGTLDVTVFNVVNDDGDFRFPILAKCVEPLGTEYLVRHRLRGAGYAGRWPLTAQDWVPQEAPFRRILGLSRNELQSIDREFREAVQEAVREQFLYAKRTKYTAIHAWRSGFPVFLCGGGTSCDFFQEAFAPTLSANAAWHATRAWMPRPPGLEAPGLPDGQFDRLAVAYGLSFDEAEIGELIRPENILDDRGSDARPDFTEAYVDKDMV